MKKNICLIVLSILTFFAFSITSNAANISGLNSGDIIIGSTKFNSGTWISSSRAAKAGALHSKITGNYDIKTYYYVNPVVIYEIDEEGQNKLLSNEEIALFNNEINIYYINNEAVQNTYDATALYEDFLYEYDPKFLVVDSDDVTIDIEKKQVTCPYGEEFEVKFVFDEFSEVGPIKVKCGYDGILTHEFVSTFTKISLTDITPTVGETYLNQNKINLTKDSNKINLKVTGKLEEYDTDDFYYEEDTYYAIDLVFEEKNYALGYEIYSDFNYIREDSYDNTNIIRLLIPVYMYEDETNYSFVVLDKEYNEYVEIKIETNGLDKTDEDFYYNRNITKVDASINPNSDSIGEITYAEGELDIELIDSLSPITHNGVEANWVTLDIEFDSIFKLEHLVMDSSIENTYDYEIIENKQRLWINFDNIDAPILGFRFYYPLTNSRFKTDELNVRFIDKSITYEWGTEKDSAGQQYLYVVDGKGNKVSGIVNITYTGTDYSTDVLIDENGKLLVPSLITINSVTKLEEGE